MNLLLLKCSCRLTTSISLPVLATELQSVTRKRTLFQQTHRHISTSSTLLLRRSPKNPPIKLFGVPVTLMLWPFRYLRAVIGRNIEPVGDEQFRIKTAKRLKLFYILSAWTFLGWLMFRTFSVNHVSEDGEETFVTTDAKYYISNMKDFSQVKDPSKIKKYQLSTSGLEKDEEFTAYAEKLHKEAKAQAYESDDPMLRKRWGLMPTKEAQRQIEEFRAAKKEEKERLYLELKKRNES
eukprot:TRINITY_DN74482_c0_g1_i1.p1 TRINITY_DN74482_c0_g1~~TRINITY_DN74482_c0_g1_i1.p1  ORF type:complete len:237 (+),score=21.90 TRINITY_DN74482_c0_g1_i1:24-734(+)